MDIFCQRDDVVLSNLDQFCIRYAIHMNDLQVAQCIKTLTE